MKRYRERAISRSPGLKGRRSSSRSTSSTSESSGQRLGADARRIPGRTRESDEKRSARSLLEWEIESQASKPLADLDEREIEWENSAVVRSPDGRVIQYQAVPSRSPTPLIGSFVSAWIGEGEAGEKEHAPLRLERPSERRITRISGLGGDYNRSFEAVTISSLDTLANSCEKFLRDTRAMWDDTLPASPEKSTGHQSIAGEALRCPRTVPGF